jgi:nicotinamide mononucleotide transporter
MVATEEVRAPESTGLSRSPHLVLNRDVVDSLWIAVALTGGSYLLAAALGWITAVNGLEAFAVFTSYACTWLCIRQRRFNYPIGALSTAAYCALFWQQGLVASAALNAYLTPSLLYGWIRWRADANTRPVSHVEGRWLPV